MNLFFSFVGKTNRNNYRKGLLLNILIVICIVTSLGILFNKNLINDNLFITIIIGLPAISIYSMVCLILKRLQSLNKPKTYIFRLLIPFTGFNILRHLRNDK